MTDVNSLFDQAQKEGIISDDAARAIQVTVNDPGAKIQGALGVSVEDVPSSEVVLVAILVDDSSSITFVDGNCQAVMDGVNGVYSALGDSKQNEAILVHSRLMNAPDILCPCVSLGQAIRLDKNNYDPRGATPLYDKTAEIFAVALAKTTEFDDSGVPCRTATLIVTDGADTSSHIHRKPESVAPIVQSMMKSEMHIVAGMGIDDRVTDFNDIFSRMGIPKRWILTPGNTPSEIRNAFGVFSRSVVQASQNAQAFSQAALGGFGS